MKIINENLPDNLMAWFFFAFILLGIGIVAAARFLFKTTKKGVQKLNEKKRK
jgi:hypothetical protein